MDLAQLDVFKTVKEITGKTAQFLNDEPFYLYLLALFSLRTCSFVIPKNI